MTTKTKATKTVKKATKTTARKPRKTARPKSATEKKTQRKRRETVRTTVEPRQGTYRVFHLPEGLKTAIQAINAGTPESTMQFLFERAVTTHLPKIVEALRVKGVASSGVKRPMRVKVDDSTLAELAKAAQSTGLDQRQLLQACLTLVSAELG